MQIIFEDGTNRAVKNMSLNEWREFMAEFMSTNHHAASAWDIMGCVRGPDSPSETPSMSSTERNVAYRGRRARKYDTVEVLREEMFFGKVGGAARHHKGDSVKVSPSNKQDHFDVHMIRGAQALGLKVKYHKDELAKANSNSQSELKDI